jgi:hypothetical protein
VEHRDGIKKKEKSSNNELFTILNDIKVTKRGTLLDDEDNSYTSTFNTYMVLRFLSMNEGLCPLINSINHIQDSLDKKEMYKLLVNYIPKTNTYDQFVKTHSSKEVYEEDVAEYYQCSIKEAREYINIMGIDWAEKIHKSYGGK